MIIVIISSIIMAYADRWFGTENKLRGQIAGTIAIAFIAFYNLNSNYSATDWLFIPVLIASFVSFLSLRQWGIWGELFPNSNKDHIDKHLWFVKLVNRCTGIQYSMRKGIDLIRWKRIAWGFRYAIYGLPLALLIAVCSFSLAPLALVTVAGFIRGTIYEYGLSEGKQLSWCEFVSGGVTMLIIGL